MTIKKFEGRESAEVLRTLAGELIDMMQMDLTSLGNEIRSDSESHEYIEAAATTGIATAAMDLLARWVFECGGDADAFEEALAMSVTHPLKKLENSLKVVEEIRSGKESNDIAAGAAAANEFMQNIVNNAKKG